jgi:N-acyl homoserine lactone hydrolase
VACYLVVHPRGAVLFDTGLPDEIAGRPFNESPLSGDPNAPSTAYFMLVTKTLGSQLASIGYNADKIDYLVLSHPHRDHVGNANDYAGSTWLVQKADHDSMFGPEVAPQSINPSYQALQHSRKQLLQGDHDVFGDGTVILKHTPGHTAGHQALYVKLARTGGIVLSGDLYHYPEERTLDRMPEREKTTGTAASRAALDAFMTEVGAQLWIGHDITANSRQKKAPEYYD